MNPSSNEPLMGRMFETYIAQNLSGIIDGKWTDARLYFWSLQGRHEVDFVVEVGNHCIALEIKSGARWQDRDLAGLRAFSSTTPHCKAAILGYNGMEPVKLGEKTWALPLSLLLS